MKLSPLEFAREFEKLKSDLARLPATDSRLMRLTQFWKQLAPVASEAPYQSYADEYRALLIGLVQPDALPDLSMDSLKQVRNVLDDLIDLSGVETAPNKLQTAATAVSLRMATLLFYVGEYAEAVSLCSEISGVEEPALPYSDELRGMSPVDTLREICKKVRSEHDALFQLLQPILAKWEEVASAVNHDRIWCLFIDKDGADAAAMGRMRLLRGTVEQVAAKKESSLLPGLTDQVAFNNQVKTPDDPFIGVVYESLKAVRLGLRSAGFARRADGAYRAFLSIERSNRTFTGDSIGLAAALVSFTQLLKPEVMRHDRFIASDIAVTGSINADGEITAVNDATIAAKIERAFFSHVRYVVVPEANAATARDTLARLHEQHPHRHLRLISASHLNDVLDDRNIIRSEKVCWGEFIVKKTARYSRATKVQVPFLIGLLAIAFLLYADYYPKHWPQTMWFDWNPQYVRLTERGFEALNKDSIRVWDVEYECDGLSVESTSEIGDLDGNGKNEVVFVPKALDNMPCESNANLFVYDCEGNLLFQRYCAKDNEYPGTQPPCGVNPVSVEKVGDRRIIITRTTRSYPARLYLMFWNPEGDLLGWYINAGYSGAFGDCFAKESRAGLLFLSLNNRKRQACLFALSPDSTHGVSPPYTDENYRLENLKRGNQLHYVLFPRTDVNLATYRDYSYPVNLVVESDNVIRADIREAWRGANVSYYLNEDFRVFRVNFDDLFLPLRDSLVDAGLLPRVNMSTYAADLRDSVTYWTDSGWVTEGDFRASGQ
jgi:hypothetical protein